MFNTLQHFLFGKSPSTSPNCITVTFVLDGVTYTYDVPKVDVVNGKNYYNYDFVISGVSYYVASDWNGVFWTIYIFTPNCIPSTYTKEIDSQFPIFDDWVFYSGNTELDNLATTFCS